MAVVAAMSGRCIECFDPAPEGWKFCRRCHAHYDLQIALRYAGNLGIDEARLKRALRILSPRCGQRYPTIAMFDKLLRRISELEESLS